MFRNVVFSAFGAAIAIAVLVSGLQSVTTEPLILHAEEFEGGGGHDHAGLSGIHPAVATVSDARFVLVHTEAAAGEEEEWGPADGFERTFYTVLANLVVGFAGSLMLLGAMMLKGETIDARRGLLWGLGAFAAASLLPGLGLPPELPGTPAAELADRQLWWLGTAVASAAGIGLLAYGKGWAFWVAGIVLLVAPHVIGAPVPPSHDVDYPGALAGQFVTASLVVSLALWALAGLVGGGLYARLARSA